MGLPPSQINRLVHSAIASQGFLVGQFAWRWRPQSIRRRELSSEATSKHQQPQSQASSSASAALSEAFETRRPDRSSSVGSSARNEHGSSVSELSMPPGWEDNPDFNISKFSELPHRHLGANQHLMVNQEFKKALGQVLWQFKAPIRYAFAYGSGVFPQSLKMPEVMPESPHPNAPEAVAKWQSTGAKTIDFVFGVSYTQHWHSLNLNQHRDHYSFLKYFGSGLVKRIQDGFGAGAYFNPYVIINGMAIKYAVVNLDTLSKDLLNWNTLYLAGRLQKPVKILRDDPRIRLANQINLISAVRTALLMLPENFTERDLYAQIAGLSYMGDLRMYFRAENPNKVFDIVDSQMTNFRQLYYPLIEDLPNLGVNDPMASEKGWMASAEVNCNMQQDMDPVKRGNMVRRLPKAFRRKLYDHYQGVFQVPAKEFRDLVAGSKNEDAFSRRMGGDFDRRVGTHDGISEAMRRTIKSTVTWPAVTQSFKGILTAGPVRSWRYVQEKRAKGRMPI